MRSSCPLKGTAHAFPAPTDVSPLGFDRLAHRGYARPRCQCAGTTSGCTTSHGLEQLESLCRVTDADVRAAADALLATGMKDAGYIYVNIDEGWEGSRDSEGKIRPNGKFPDMFLVTLYEERQRIGGRGPQ